MSGVRTSCLCYPCHQGFWVDGHAMKACMGDCGRKELCSKRWLLLRRLKAGLLAAEVERLNRRAEEQADALEQVRPHRPPSLKERVNSCRLQSHSAGRTTDEEADACGHPAPAPDGCDGVFCGLFRRRRRTQPRRRSSARCTAASTRRSRRRTRAAAMTWRACATRAWPPQRRPSTGSRRCEAACMQACMRA